MNFYTNVKRFGRKILYRGVMNGRKISHEIEYRPKLFLRTNTPSKFKTITGLNVGDMEFASMSEASLFIKEKKNIDGFKIYGNSKFEYTFIADEFPSIVDWDIDLIKITNIDIEVGSENGFPDPTTANEPVVSITMKNSDGKFIVFGCGSFENTREDVIYYKCRDEIDLLKRFVDEWSNGGYPDIITGWNTDNFDIPYLVNRMERFFDMDFVARLSPWGRITKREGLNSLGRPQVYHEIWGIASLDYLELYRKFSPRGKSQVSYSLDSISNVELGEKKLSYSEYLNLHTLYKKNYQLFIEYNIRDVELIDKLEDKLKLLELAMTLAYDSKTNFSDVFAQVRMWDSLIFNHLKKDKIVIPPIESHSKNEMYVGAYVKEPLIGKHMWVASFDLDSLYPHLIMQYSISPENLVSESSIHDRISKLRNSINRRK